MSADDFLRKAVTSKYACRYYIEYIKFVPSPGFTQSHHACSYALDACPGQCSKQVPRLPMSVNPVISLNPGGMKSLDH